ncbi:DNA-3-methyladenine glycosylase 1 [Dichanthelium oligosanthes]|uniref:DNA-3-methyladenine glycosylase 1 n=1 Tax=Dichanthelium oligosanthes TaxID=888268 RepID=A0A1E5W134_9POAL|nr:DNA-3-methyladenine glycosylase 1 [Dichanthelium oligosanthes]
MSAAVAPRVAGAARRLSQSPKPPGARDKEPPTPPPRQHADKASRRRLLPTASAPAQAARGAAASMLLRRAAGAGGRGNSYVHPSASLSVSCASEASAESFCSRASTGRIGRRPAGPPVGAPRRRAAGSAGPPSARPATSRKAASVVPGGTAAAPAVPVLGSFNGEPTATPPGPPRCPWVTPNTDPCYAAFHDQEWGVPVHDDKKLFEMLTLSGALAEMAWPAILSKRNTFREVFMGFDPVLVAKLNEKKFLAPSSPASSLLSEHRLRIIIENARELLKVIEEFGSFDSYCWSFLSSKPMVGRYRHTREVPLRTAKADAISQDLMHRGFLGVGPTVVYAFMQAVGMANDHLVTCYRFEECCDIKAAAADNCKPVAAVSEQEVSMLCGLVQCVGLEPSRTATVISIS